MELRKCSICKKCLSVDNFSKDNSRKDGLQRVCKDCIKKYHKEHNTNFNRKKYFKKYYSKPEIKKRQSNYYKKYGITKKGKMIKKNAYNKYIKTKKGKTTRNHVVRRWQKTEKGKLSMKRHDAKRRNLKFIPLFKNPFPKEIKVDYHHINSLLVIPLPKKTHRLYTGNDKNYHREKCNGYIKKLFVMDIKKLIKGDFYKTQRH